jgi:hypothetical protein
MSKKKKQDGPAEESVARRHEVVDIYFGRVTLTGVGLLAIMVAGLVYSELVESIFSGTTAEPGAPLEVFVIPEASELPPQPRVEADPNAALVVLRAREDSVLGGYRWADSGAGLVQVPVGRAMELILEKGLLKNR